MVVSGAVLLESDRVAVRKQEVTVALPSKPIFIGKRFVEDLVEQVVQERGVRSVNTGRPEPVPEI
jgi:hypothetical protein